MTIGTDSRNLLTNTIRIISPVTGATIQPEFVDLRQRVTAQAADDQFVVADQSKSWSHIGDQYLGDARRWWVFADMSGVVDPFVELVPGVVLQGPSITRFLFQVIAPNQTSS